MSIDEKQYIALLDEILDSDMAQREEDEGQESAILEKVRRVVSDYRTIPIKSAEQPVGLSKLRTAILREAESEESVAASNREYAEKLKDEQDFSGMWRAKDLASSQEYQAKKYRGFLELLDAAESPPARESIAQWRSMDTAPRDGRRVALLCDDEIYHGWYEENFNCFMGMDEDWNLWKLGPSGWQPLSKIEDGGSHG